MNRDETIAAIKSALRRRSGHAWSVTGGRGTAYGWITIAPLPRERKDPELRAARIAELSQLLDKTVHHQGELIPASRDYRREYVDRAEGRPPSVSGHPYWD